MLEVEKRINQVISSKGTAIVLGLGTTGGAAIRFFHQRNVSVIVLEKSSKERFVSTSTGKKLFLECEQKKIPVYFDDQLPESLIKKLLLSGSNVVSIISPGIASSAKAPSYLRDNKIPIFGELEMALALTKVPAIMVTGSNGKSTTVTLINEIFKEAQFNSFLCGNIGHPVLEVLDHAATPDLLVVEASSYQLESAHSIKPKIGVLLNLSENHLERHGTLEKYLAAKLKIFANQDSGDFAILNADDPVVSKVLLKNNPQILYYGKNVLNKGNYAKYVFEPQNNIDKIEVSYGGESVTFDCSGTKLIGEHTRANLAAAILAAKIYKIKNSSIEHVINNFEGLAHRLQRVATASGLFAVNDSKSTTVASSLAAIESIRKNYPANPICILIGGKMKIGSWQPLAKALLAEQQDVSHPKTRVICFGGDGLIIKHELENMKVQALFAKNVSEAVSLSCDWIRGNEIVLFSPGGASFDEFLNFEKRGEFFSQIIQTK